MKYLYEANRNFFQRVCPESQQEIRQHIDVLMKQKSIQDKLQRQQQTRAWLILGVSVVATVFCLRVCSVVFSLSQSYDTFRSLGYMMLAVAGILLMGAYLLRPFSSYLERSIHTRYNHLMSRGQRMPGRITGIEILSHTTRRIYFTRAPFHRGNISFIVGPEMFITQSPAELAVNDSVQCFVDGEIGVLL